MLFNSSLYVIINLTNKTKTLTGGITKTQLTFKGQVTKGESVIKTYESPLYSLQIATDLEKGYTTAAVKSLSSKNLLPLITVSKDDGVFQVQLSTSGVSGFTADEIIEGAELVLAAGQTAKEIEELLK